MYLRHYDTDQNGPTFSEEGGGEGERGGIGVYETAELKKIHLRPQQKFV